jgi:LmbE family N-acetylglucosaminyl deacetylase
MLEKLKSSERLLILSPHLDDAVLSVGGIMERAINSGVAVIAGTIFTADANEAIASSPRVKELHSLWRLGDNPTLIRREEDIGAVQSLGSDYIHGNLPDAIYRTDTDGQALYPTTRGVFSEPSPKEKVWLLLRSLLEEWLNVVKPGIVLCPLAVGRHVDHVITSEAFRGVQSAEKPAILLYEDMPYSAGFSPPGLPDTVDKAISRSRWSVGTSITVPVDTEKKVAAIRKYKSQLPELFPDGRVEEEVKSYMRLESNAGFQERLWFVQ